MKHLPILLLCPTLALARLLLGASDFFIACAKVSSRASRRLIALHISSN